MNSRIRVFAPATVANLGPGFDVLGLALSDPGDLGDLLDAEISDGPGVQIVEVTGAQAPAQQVVLTGTDADLTDLPVHLGHGCDGGPYISSSIDFVLGCAGDIQRIRDSEQSLPLRVGDVPKEFTGLGILHNGE